MTAEPVSAIEKTEFLDTISEPVAAWVGKAVAADSVQNALSGTWLGHKLHPMLTDVPLGAWLMASCLDWTMGAEAGEASRRLVGLGVLASVPTAMSGANDWSTTHGADQRVGLVHGVANASATALQALSWWARRRGSRRAGVALSTAGLGLALGSAYLGGHLSLVRGVGVDNTAFEGTVGEWTDVAAESDVEEGRPLRVRAGEVPVMVVRHKGELYALSATCVHAGGPLDEGEVTEAGAIVCPWHQSTFRLSDGKVLRGPASDPEPEWQVEVRAGRVRVRSAPGD